MDSSVLELNNPVNEQTVTVTTACALNVNAAGTSLAVMLASGTIFCRNLIWNSFSSWTIFLPSVTIQVKRHFYAGRRRCRGSSLSLKSNGDGPLGSYDDDGSGEFFK